MTLGGGRVYVTAGIAALGSVAQTEIMAAVQEFDRFDSGNDPYGEHDFGSFDYNGETIFWKIDAYQKGSDYTAGAETPEDTTMTERVLTILLAAEY